MLYGIVNYCAMKIPHNTMVRIIYSRNRHDAPAPFITIISLTPYPNDSVEWSVLASGAVRVNVPVRTRC